ncbi:MAG: ATPase [Anaerolineae bacterium]|jgi:circadian clock protein KaiC|nr:ATPase [Anaerolineae bacterium]
MSTNRIPTGILGLDEMLHGGFLGNTANLVEGAPGTGKSTLGMQFIEHGIAAHNEAGIILTFEEFPEHYYRDAANFGWDFHAHEAANRLRVIMSSPEVTRADMLRLNGQIEMLVHQIEARRVLVDSLSHFERLAESPVELRQTIFEFINGLKRLDLTAVLTRENAALLGELPDVEENLAFVADSYTLLRYVEIQSAVHKALLVLKLRGSDHDKNIRHYEITGQGLVVRSRFEGTRGIMSGTPTMTHAEAFAAAFLPSDKQTG